MAQKLSPNKQHVKEYIRKSVPMQDLVGIKSTSSITIALFWFLLFFSIKLPAYGTLNPWCKKGRGELMPSFELYYLNETWFALLFSMAQMLSEVIVWQWWGLELGREGENSASVSQWHLWSWGVSFAWRAGKNEIKWIDVVPNCSDFQINPSPGRGMLCPCLCRGHIPPR